MKPYDPLKAHRLKTAIKGELADRGHVAHFVLPAAGAIAADDDYIVTAIATTAAVQTLDSIDFDNILATPGVSVKSVTVGRANREYYQLPADR